MQDLYEKFYNFMLNPNHEAPSVYVIVLIVGVTILVSFIQSRKK